MGLRGESKAARALRKQRLEPDTAPSGDSQKSRRRVLAPCYPHSVIVLEITREPWPSGPTRICQLISEGAEMSLILPQLPVDSSGHADKIRR